MSINVEEAFATKNRRYQAAAERIITCRRILRFTCGSGRHKRGKAGSTSKGVHEWKLYNHMQLKTSATRLVRR